MKLWVATSRVACAAAVSLALSLAAFAQDITGQNWGKDSAGVKLALHEGPRKRSPNGTILLYNVVGQGFPSGAAFQLWQWAPGKDPTRLMEGVSFDKRGVLVCAGKPGFCKGDGPDDPINIQSTAALGEPKRVAVVSPDGKIAGFAEAIPFSIEASDNNCKLSVVRASPLAESVVARATGFSPLETLTVTTKSNDEGRTTENQAGRDGDWSGMLIVQVKGQSAGKTMLTVSGKSCTVSVTFPWGVGSNHPL